MGSATLLLATGDGNVRHDFGSGGEESDVDLAFTRWLFLPNENVSPAGGEGDASAAR